MTVQKDVNDNFATSIRIYISLVRSRFAVIHVLQMSVLAITNMVFATTDLLTMINFKFSVDLHGKAIFNAACIKTFHYVL